jgi:hypothetical protein
MSDDQNNSEATPAPSQSAAENTPPPPPPPPPPSIDTQMSALIKGSDSGPLEGERFLGIDTSTDE